MRLWGMGSVVLFGFCRFGSGVFWRSRASTFFQALDLWVRIQLVAPPGFRACYAWVRKSQNFLLVSSRFDWVGLLASFGGFLFCLYFLWVALVTLSFLYLHVEFLPGTPGCWVPLPWHFFCLLACISFVLSWYAELPMYIILVLFCCYIPQTIMYHCHNHRLHVGLREYKKKKKELIVRNECNMQYTEKTLRLS